MIAATGRVLALVCTLLLALPPGWCCILQSTALAVRGKERLAARPACCGHCKGHAPTKSSDPVRLPPGSCPCTDRALTVPSAPRVVACESAVVTPLALPEPVVSGATAGDGGACSLPVFSLPPRVLNCLWLC
jgi:hypothetical protein